MREAAPLPRVAAAALALCALLGCASPPRSERVVLLDTQSKVLLILPLNVAAVMPPELEGVSPIVWKELERYLRAQGMELKTVNRKTARGLWIQSIRQARADAKGAPAGYDDAARLLARELRKHAEFDAMIAPSLFVREAPIALRSARWDGVERDIEFEAHGLAARSIAATPLEGAAPAASIHVAVFDAEGEKIHEAQGGLEVLVRVRVTVNNPSGRDDAINAVPELGNAEAHRPPAPSFEFLSRTDLFANRAHVREGLNVAFLPFLPPLRE